MGENGTNKKNFYAFIRMSQRPGRKCCRSVVNLRNILLYRANTTVETNYIKDGRAPSRGLPFPTSGRMKVDIVLNQYFESWNSLNGYCVYFAFIYWPGLIKSFLLICIKVLGKRIVIITKKYYPICINIFTCNITTQYNK